MAIGTWLHARSVLLVAVVTSVAAGVSGLRFWLDQRQLEQAGEAESSLAALTTDLLRWTQSVAVATLAASTPPAQGQARSHRQAPDALLQQVPELRARLGAALPAQLAAFDNLASHVVRVLQPQDNGLAPEPRAPPDAASAPTPSPHAQLAHLAADSGRLADALREHALATERQLHARLRTHGTLFAGMTVACVLLAWMAYVVNRSQQQRVESLSARYFHRATHDALTALPNRELLYDRLSAAMALARRRRERLTLIFLDLDGFKAVNDQHGHQVGDATLKEVAQRLRQVLRDSDTVARLGGDEFAVLLPGIGAPGDAEGVARKIIEAVGRPLPLHGGRTYQVGTSIGIAHFPDHGLEIDSLIRAADAAMYACKKDARNQFRVAAPRVAAEGERGSWFEFVDVYRLGIDVIDEQHQHIVAQLNELNRGVSLQLPAPQLLRRFDDLAAYVVQHFATEEAQMAAGGYPGLEGHRREHRQLVDEVGSLRERFADGGELLALQWLKDWITAHVSSSDRVMSEYLMRARQAATGPGRAPGVPCALASEGSGR